MDHFQLNNKSYGVFVDRFSNWPGVYIGDSGTEVSKVIVRICEDYGIPESITTDGGTCYTSAKVQEVMNKSLQTKYKVQVALKNYKESIEELNQAQFDMENEYKPILQQIQQYEESRINFTKYNYDKFLKHAQGLGASLQDQDSLGLK